MTPNRFAAICSSFTVDPSIALEDEEVCQLLNDDLLRPSVENRRRLEEILRENF
jgi:hypothetical protein